MIQTRPGLDCRSEGIGFDPNTLATKSGVIDKKNNSVLMVQSRKIPTSSIPDFYFSAASLGCGILRKRRGHYPSPSEAAVKEEATSAQIRPGQNTTRASLH